MCVLIGAFGRLIETHRSSYFVPHKRLIYEAIKNNNRIVWTIDLLVQVAKHFAPEGDDDLGDLWLVEYEDGDAEHMDMVEVKSWL